MCDVKVRGRRVWVTLLEDALFYVIWTLWQHNISMTPDFSTLALLVFFKNILIS